MKFQKIRSWDPIPPFSQFIKEQREHTEGRNKDYYLPEYTDYIYLLVPEESDYEFLKNKLRSINGGE